MVVKTENISLNEVKVYIESTPDQVSKFIADAYRKNKSKYNIKGFRPGKAPQNVIEQFYGKEAFYSDAFDLFVNDEYSKALQEHKLNSYGDPKISDVVVEADKMAFCALVTIIPDPVFGNYKGIEVPDLKTEVSDEEIENEIKSEIKKNSRLIEVTDRTAQNGDVLSVDFVGTVDGVEFEGGKAENQTITLGEGKFIPGFEEQLIGASTGSDVTVKVKFPDEYTPELAGKDAEFAVKVHDIKIWEEPEFNDEFVSDISEFETIDEYKASIKDKLVKQKELNVKKEKEDFAVASFVKNTEISLPQQMIDNHFEDDKNSFKKRLESYGLTVESYAQMMGSTVEEMDKDLSKESYRNLSESYALVKLAEHESLFPDNDQIEQLYILKAAQYKMTVEEFKEAVQKRPGMMEFIIEEAMKEAAIKFLMDNSVNVDPDVLLKKEETIEIPETKEENS